MPNQKKNDQKNDALLEKIIIFLIVAVGAIVVFNQFNLSKFSSNTLLNAISFILILGIIGLITWILIKKEKDIEKQEQLSGVENKKQQKQKIPFTTQEIISYGFVAAIAVLVMFNQMQVSDINSLASGHRSSSFVSSVSSNILKLGGGGKSGVIIGPQINPDGRTTKLVEWPTISDTPSPKKTGDATKDAIVAVVPTGTPFYASEGSGAEKIKGATFDDPLASQKVWASLLGSKRFGTANKIDLSPEEEQRWNKIVGAFTCDYCCGGPNSVTTISNCGCAHSYAWQGMAKFFVKYYPEYTDEQIAGEMTKWKAIWYPKGMIQDYLVYTGQASVDTLTHGGSIGIRQQFLQSGGSGQKHTQASATPLDELPSMVGGC